MKRKDYRRIEAVAQEMLNAPTEDSTERMEEVKERAFQTYMLRQEQEAAGKIENVRVRKHEKRGPRPGLMTAIALVWVFMFLPMISDMLFPVRVSMADDGWKRTVIIWLNDTFHTKIQVPESVHDDGGISQMNFGEERIFYDIDEAARFVGTGLVTIGGSDWRSEISSITVSAMGEGIYRVVEKCSVDDIAVAITMRTVLDRETNAILVETHFLDTPIGDMMVWTQEDARYGFVIAGDWAIMVSADCSMEMALRMFSTVHFVN